jgi:hypothetical protein
MRARRAACVIAVIALTTGAARAENDHKYAVGARIRGVFVTRAMLSPFLLASTELTTMSGGAEFIVRKRTFDIVTSLDLTFISMRDGNFLGAGRDPSQDTHYTQFGNFGQLSMLSADVSIIGHSSVTRWLELRYGAGVGLGLVIGDVKVITNSRMCTAENANDGTRCFPISPTVGAIPLDQPDTQAKLDATQDPVKVDIADDPHYHVTRNKPPVIPVVNFLFALRFKVHKRLAFDVETGFRDAIFVGGAFHTLF